MKRFLLIFLPALFAALSYAGWPMLSLVETSEEEEEPPPVVVEQDPPTLMPVADVNVELPGAQGSAPVTIPVVATGSPEPVVTFDGLPGFLTFSDGMLQGTATSAHAGNYTVTVTASSDAGTIQATFSISVAIGVPSSLNAAVLIFRAEDYTSSTWPEARGAMTISSQESPSGYATTSLVTGPYNMPGVRFARASQTSQAGNPGLNIHQFQGVNKSFLVVGWTVGGYTAGGQDHGVLGANRAIRSSGSTYEYVTVSTQSVGRYFTYGSSYQNKAVSLARSQVSSMPAGYPSIPFYFFIVQQGDTYSVYTWMGSTSKTLAGSSWSPSLITLGGVHYYTTSGTLKRDRLEGGISLFAAWDFPLTAGQRSAIASEVLSQYGF